MLHRTITKDRQAASQNPIVNFDRCDLFFRFARKSLLQSNISHQKAFCKGRLHSFFRARPQPDSDDDDCHSHDDEFANLIERGFGASIAATGDPTSCLRCCCCFM